MENYRQYFKDIISGTLEDIDLQVWRSGNAEVHSGAYHDYNAGHYLLKEELLPDGTVSRILKHKTTDVISKISLTGSRIQ